MKFRTARGDRLDRPADAVDPEDERVQVWQRHRLSQIGYDGPASARLVTAAWEAGEQAGLVHRIEDLVGRGATLDQAARIVAPLGTADLDPEGAPDAG
jgi:hypothetical protein